MICPTCRRDWLPLTGEDPEGECNLCRHGIGTCALVGGKPRKDPEWKPCPKEAAK